MMGCDEEFERGEMRTSGRLYTACERDSYPSGVIGLLRESYIPLSFSLSLSGYGYVSGE